MVSKSFTIKNKMGLHMRPANVFVTAMTKYESEIFIQFGGKKINGKSGSDIVVECDGPDEETMMAQVSELIESGFGEE